MESMNQNSLYISLNFGELLRIKVLVHDLNTFIYYIVTFTQARIVPSLGSLHLDNLEIASAAKSRPNFEN